MSDVFSVDAPVANQVQLVINGVEQGSQTLTSPTRLQAFVIQKAQAAGIRTFHVYVDGVKMDSTNANDDISEAEKIEIVAKDSRG